MTRRASILIALACLIMAATASAQDTRSLLQASAKAMSLANLKTIQFSGSGWFSMIGQTYGLNEDWPHYEVNPYTRAIDYDAKFSRGKLNPARVAMFQCQHHPFYAGSD